MDNPSTQSHDQTGGNRPDQSVNNCASVLQEQQPAQSASEDNGPPGNTAVEADEVLAQAADHSDREQEEDEEEYDDTDYAPYFILELLDKPPIAAGESADAFGALFESYELDFMSPHRPKTDREYMLVAQATTISWELMRYDRMKSSVLQLHQHAAVDRVHRRCNSAASGQKSGPKTEPELPMRYFTDPAYRQQFAAKLEQAGFSPVVIEADAYLRSLMALSKIEHLMKSAENRLARMLRELEVTYLRRDPEQPLPRSNAARRVDERKQGPGS
ncbi:hypothetical protein ACE103_28130 [Bradyrhizobium sp. ma5]|uniref:hypothetical protein n=1 Tax=Bradyrhizobium sp. ma5 TaxID=3344828 RepID=UPI0035D4F1E8